jgi:hypothetical protein
MTTDTTERGLERLICVALTGSSCEPGGGSAQESEERPAIYGTGWSGGLPEDYDREYCVDRTKLAGFLRTTQPDAAEALDLSQDGPTRRNSPRSAAGRRHGGGRRRERPQASVRDPPTPWGETVALDLAKR